MDLPDRFSVDDACAFWRGLRVPDTAAVAEVPAARFPPDDGWAPFEGCDIAAVDAEQLLWHAPDRSRAFANGHFFSDLDVVDVTALDGVAALGIAKPSLTALWPKERILRFLIPGGHRAHLRAHTCRTDPARTRLRRGEACGDL